MADAPYGSWRSPITSDLITAESITLFEPRVDGDAIYWLELRPREQGRVVVVRHDSGGQTVDVIGPTFNARTRVHEYGGGAYAVGNGVVYLSNFTDQQLHRVRPGRDPEPLTTEAGLRYADAIVDPRRTGSSVSGKTTVCRAARPGTKSSGSLWMEAAPPRCWSPATTSTLRRG